MGIISYDDYIKENKLQVYKDKVLSDELTRRRKGLDRIYNSNFNQQVGKYVPTQKIDIANNDIKNVTKFEQPKNLYGQTKQEQQESQKLYNEKLKQFVNSDWNKDFQVQRTTLRNSELIQDYYNRQNEISNEESSYLDKSIIVNSLRGAKSLVTPFLNSDQYITREDGTKYFLPTDSDIKMEKAKEDSSGFRKFLIDASYNMGKIGASTAINTLTGGSAGSMLYFGNMYTTSLNQAISNGYDKDKALLYATASTGTEYLTGKLLGTATKGLTRGNVLKFDDAITNKLMKKFGANQAIAKFLGNAGSEATEEFLQEYIDNFNKLIFLENSTDIKDYWDVIRDEDVLVSALYSAGIGAVSGGLLGNISSEQNVYDTYKKELINLKSKTTDTNTIKKIDNILEKIDTIKYSTDRSEKIERNINNITNIINNTRTDTSDIIANNISTISNENSVQTNKTKNSNDVNNISTKLPTVQDIVNQEKLNQNSVNLPVYNQQSNITNFDKAIMPTMNDFNSSNINMPASNIKVDMAKIKPEILEDIKSFKLGDLSIESFKGSYIKTMLNEVGIKVPNAMNYVSEVRPDMSFTTTKDLTRQQYSSISNALQKLRSIDVTSVNNANYSIPIGNYQYVKSANANINELRRTASMYLNNTARSNNTIRLLENIIKDRNYIIRFNPNITNEQGVSVNGLIKRENGKTIIELNPNADNYVEFLIVHEITHDIATKEMKELIFDYAKQDSEFEKSLESLKERYKTDDVSDEIVADVCGELFGNREFIQSVVEKKPNIFKKILNNIRKLAEKIKSTGANEYVDFVEKLQTMWEDAYYSNRSNLSKTMHHLSQDALNEVDDALNNPKTDINSMVKLRDFTPEQLVSVGVNDLPMLVRKGHLRENILTSLEAKEKGYSTKGKHYHGLGIDTYMNAIDSLDNPIAVYQYTDKGNYSKDNFIVLTEVKDSDNNNIIVPIEIHKRGQYNKVEIDINRIKTTYGKNNSNYFDDMVKNGSLVEIYNKKRSAKLPIQSGNFNTSTANNIPQSNNNVNSGTSSTTKYFIPINKNNTQELNNGSFSLEQRVSGDKLLDVQDLIEEIKSVGAKVDKNGYVTLYHQTTNENADKIKQSGKMFAKEPYVYFSTSENASQAEGRGNTKLEFKIPAEKLILDDIFEDNADVKIKLNSNKELDVSDYIVSKSRSSISNNHKKKQLDIIKNNNPVNDDYHTWIRNVEDIKTLEETINDSDWSDYDEFNPDLTRQDIENAIDSGKITVYSSYPIKQGIFVSPSKMEAESYSSNGKVYSKEVNINDVAWIDPTQGQYAKVYDILPTKYSQNAKEWNEYLKENFPSSGTKTKMSDIKLPVREDVKINSNKRNVLNPLEISKLTKEDANTTPILPKRGNINKVNDGDSHFASNIENKVNMLSDEQKNIILSEKDVLYYDKVANKESLEKAFNRLNKNGSSETLRWLNLDSKNANATDVAEGWILLKQYSDNGNYDSMVEVAKKMREIGTTSGQTVQAFNIMERMTPEGMVKYAQSELSEAYDRMIKNKTKEWIDKHRKDFDLKPEEVKFIMDTMQEVQNMEDGYNKRVKLAEIQKIMTDKLPPEKGAGIKAWMRISMLFNPKTQVRNVMGNAIIAPVNIFGDLFASAIDRQLAKSTGVRTTGTFKVKSYGKGFKTGLFQSYNDFKKGINTRDIKGNRFEITEGKSFNENTLIGKKLNQIDALLSFMLDAGDRTFYEATFTNSINNQLILNNTDIVTQEMVDIATSEALSRTWQDNNNYTKFVLNVRKGLNAINVKGYGLGDVLIPFAKTPANLTKAIVDYSPAGLVNAIHKGINLKRSLTNGQYTANMQHEFVQSLGKATAGTMLYILGIALAKAGITGGKSDDDKDTANFLKNTLGVSSYSIKIGNKSFTYDWAQPIAAPLSITADVVNSKKNKSQALLESVISSLDTAGSILLEQSFLQSINDVLSDNDGVVSGIINEILELPARAIPTLSKQIADLVDGTQRTSFEYGKPIKSAFNSMKSKIPFVSKTLSPSVDTLGREIKKYGGKNNIFNVFLNPANVNTENISESAEEIYRLYQSTGETNIMPRVAPYYINQKGEKIILTSTEKSEYQKISGNIVEENVKELLENKDYKKLDDTEKAEIINKIVNYSYNKARKDVLEIEMSDEYNKINNYIDDGGSVANYYLNKREIDYSYTNPNKYKTIIQISSYNNYLSYKNHIDETKEKYNNSLERKKAVIEYVNSLDLTIPQKAMLIKMNYSSFSNYDNQIINYINSQEISIDDKKEILEELGFKVRNGRVYTK